MNKTKLLLIASLPLSLLGCFEQNKTTDELCKQNPNLRCEQLNIDDGQCRVARTDLIWHRQDVLLNPSEANKIIEYKKVAEYRQCLELASQISPLNQPELKERRFNALVHSISELERIVEELQGSDEANTLYFLWSQTGDLNARRAFLQLEPTGKLDTAEMQYALATFYISRDQKKTIKLLNNALKLSKKGEANSEILKSLASLHQGMNHRQQAYMWAMVAKEFGVPLANEAQLKRMYQFANEATYGELEDLADNVASAIKDGRYSPNMVTISEE